MTRVIRESKKRRTPLLVMALLGVMVGVLIGGGSFSSAASTSPSVSDYSQCANGKPGTANPEQCNSGMINGILNANNSQYSEDQVTAQRLVVVFPLAGDHTIDLQYLVRKADNHAYDSLATWDHTETGADRCLGFAGKAKTNCEAATGGTLVTKAIPDDSLTVPSACTTTSTTTSNHQLSGQEFQMFGATFNGTPTYLGTTSDTSQGLYQNIEIPINTAGANATVYFYFGGHLAAGLGSRAWGSGCGASNINGGPYHIKLNAIDGTAGSRDNQITAGAIIAQTPSIDTTPTNDESFSETLNDSVTLGGGATGSVHFYLFDNATDCTTAGSTVTSSSTGVLYSETVTAVAGSAATDANGSPAAGNVVNATGDYYWTVIYDGDGSLNLSASSICQEHTAVTAPVVTNTPPG
jgi:hypothetical protein